MLQKYFQENKIAIRFNTKEEHRDILKYFNACKLPLNSGICTFHKRQLSESFIIHYAFSSLESIHYYKGYTILSFEEFKEVTTTDALQLFENN
jgi:hypothetical protein